MDNPAICTVLTGDGLNEVPATAHKNTNNRSFSRFEKQSKAFNV
jgi:hypothetical protein